MISPAPRPAAGMAHPWAPWKRMLLDVRDATPPGTPVHETVARLTRLPIDAWSAADGYAAFLACTTTLREQVEALGWDPDLVAPVPAPTDGAVVSPVDPPAGTSDEPPVGTITLADRDHVRVVLPPGAAWPGDLPATPSGAGRTVRILASHVDPLRTLVRAHRLAVAPDAAAALRDIAARRAEQSDTTVPDGAMVDLSAKGQVQITAEPVKALVSELTRIPSLRWNDAAKAWLAPRSRLADVARVAEQFSIPLSAAAQAAYEEETGPFDYDGTLAGLRGVPVSALACVDATKASRFADFGVDTVFDLLMLIPRRYIDRSAQQRIADLTAGEEAAFLARVDRVVADSARRMVKIDVSDGSGKLNIAFFNALWQAKRFRVGDQVLVSGKVDEWVGDTRRRLQMANPMMDPWNQDTLPIIPVYPQSAKSKVTTWDIHTAVKEALARIGTLDDPLPDSIRAEHAFPAREDALRTVHLPEALTDVPHARNRLAFDELLDAQVALLLSKRAVEHEPGVRHAPTGTLTSALVANLPFPLTGAQARTWDEISRDLATVYPMHRLLQGDVGAGKTVLAAMTLAAAVESGHQAALMAPTEILATQLHAEMERVFAGLCDANGHPIRVALVTNRLRGKNRAAVLDALADGSIHVAVGTHALIVDEIQFASLGVVVVDEQHRFGVEQRAALREKGPARVRPDMLVMTATPIPRTAAMTVFGDLDVSVLDELPPGRTPIATSWLDETPNLDVLLGEPWQSVRDAVQAGHQAYVVCPLVEESEKMTAANATETFDALSAGALAGMRLGLVHGQQKTEERNEVMDAFRDHDLDVLVATTVIEVGVNVPNATVIVILDSNRFGIAQLHQLRGRVGRGTAASRCLLVGRCVSADARARMEALVASTDGFYLSEVDLDLRGHGQVFGTQQSGVSDLKVADLTADRDMLEQARTVAVALMDADPDLTRSGPLLAEVRAMLGDAAHEWLGKS